MWAEQHSSTALAWEMCKHVYICIQSNVWHNWVEVKQLSFKWMNSKLRSESVLGLILDKQSILFVKVMVSLESEFIYRPCNFYNWAFC